MKAKSRAREGALYGTLAVLTLLLIGADLAFFNGASRVPASPDVPDDAGIQECTYDPGKERVENFASYVGEDDPYVGNPDAAVTLLEFFDPNCPHCRHLHPVIKATLAAFPDEIRVVYKPIALPQFEMSVLQNAVLYAAAEEGKFTEMLDRQFELQQPGGIPPNQLMDLARQLGMDTQAMERRIRDGAYDEVMERQHRQARAAGLTGVPAVLINGRFVASSSRTEACLGQLIEAELQNAKSEG